MTIESVTYISDLDITLPANTDVKSEGDDHLRNIKLGIKNTFPMIAGAVSVSHGALNQLNDLLSGTSISGVTYVHAGYMAKNPNYFPELSLGSEASLSFAIVGPPGSTCSVTWTALASLPTGVKFIDVKVHIGLDNKTISDDVDNFFYVAPTDETVTTTYYTALNFFRCRASKSDYQIFPATIPVDTSKRFKVYWFKGIDAGVSSSYVGRFALTGWKY